MSADVAGTGTAPAVVAVDVGGTKIAAALVTWPGPDPAVPPLVGRRLMVPTPASGGGDVLRAVAGLVAALARDAPPGSLSGVGMGCPGMVDAATGTVTSATGTLPGWVGCQVRAGLERLTGLPVAVENDVRAMARGELEHGVARGLREVVFVSVGTGVGGAIVADGRLLAGAHGAAGELGHLLVPRDGPIRCGCGRRDHLEANVSGPAIAAHGGTGAALADAAALLGRALAGLVSAVDAEAVVVGGGVAQAGPAFTEPLAHALRAEPLLEDALAPLRDLTVLAAGLGAGAPLVGAALLARRAALGGRMLA